MRQITAQAIAAFCTGRSFLKGNTRVEVDGDTVRLFLFDNEIAHYHTNHRMTLFISDGGYGDWTAVKF